jgi:hypothetical protein
VPGGRPHLFFLPASSGAPSKNNRASSEASTPRFFDQSGGLAALRCQSGGDGTICRFGKRRKTPRTSRTALRGAWGLVIVHARAGRDLLFALDEKHAEGEAGLGDSRSSRPLATWRSALKRKPATEQIPVRERDIGQRVVPCLAGNRCHLLFEHLSPLSHVRRKPRVDGKRQQLLLHRLKGRGGNQVRLEIPVLATACHPDIASAEAIPQFRESAQFAEMPIQPVCRENVGRPARIHETRRQMFGQRALATGIEVAEQIETLQQFSRGRCRMEFKLRKDAPRTTSRTCLRSSDGAHPIQHF